VGRWGELIRKQKKGKRKQRGLQTTKKKRERGGRNRDWVGGQPRKPEKTQKRSTEPFGRRERRKGKVSLQREVREVFT